MSIFDKRVNYKPFEYTYPQKIIDALNKVFWVHSEVKFESDVQDYNTVLSEVEKEVYKRNFLAISQVEVAVKTFWSKLYDYFPKPEFNDLGATNAECEVRHSSAYSRGLDVLNLNSDFEALLEVPAMKRKLELVDRHMSPDATIEAKLLFFVLVVENSALFSQFAIGMSFNKFNSTMKNISNMIQWTAVEELLHAEAGIWLINEVQKEREIFANIDLESIVKEYVEVEEGVLDWIFEEGELEHFSKADLVNYIKYRIDESLVRIGQKKVFNITNEAISKLEWFEDEVTVDTLDDFFARRPVDYTKHDKPITEHDLF